MPSVDDALAHWPALAKGARVRPLAAGHINDTYIVDGKFLLQRLNRAVFPRPAAVMRNLAKAVAHEGGALLVAPIASAQSERKGCSSSNKPFAVDAHGDCWRLFPFLPSRSFQNLPDELLTPAAAAFGGFLTTFADFSETLEPVIDGFHDLGGYLNQLDAAPHTNDAIAELRAVAKLRATFAPSTVRHVIHGDCKVNNLLFHPTKPDVTAIIDLDTIMRGDPAWDFGDLVRSAFIGAEESAEQDTFSMPRFERLCDGFATTFANIDDCARFAAAPSYMSFMLAVRFLTDHLLGDVYFKVAQRGQNLLRARSQLRLAQRFRAAAPAMERALETALAKTSARAADQPRSL